MASARSNTCTYIMDQLGPYIAARPNMILKQRIATDVWLKRRRIKTFHLSLYHFAFVPSLRCRNPKKRPTPPTPLSARCPAPSEAEAVQAVRVSRRVSVFRCEASDNGRTGRPAESGSPSDASDNGRAPEATTSVRRRGGFRSHRAGRKLLCRFVEVISV